MKCDKRMKVLEIVTGILVLRTVIFQTCIACGGDMNSFPKHYFQSPNFPREYGKAATCMWRFNLGGKALKLRMANIKLYYRDANNSTQCTDAYTLVINGETVNCKQDVTPRRRNSQYHILFYESSSCAAVQCDDVCKRQQIDRPSVLVEYNADGSKPEPSLREDMFRGFRMYFKFLECPQGTTITTTTTTAIPTTTTTTTTAAAATAATPAATTTTTTAAIPTTTTTTTTTTTAAAAAAAAVAATTTTTTTPASLTTPTSSPTTGATTSIVALEVEKPRGNVAMYAAIAGGLVLVLVIIAGVFILRKRKLTKSGKSQSDGVSGNAEDAEMRSNMLYGTALDLGQTGHASMNSADVYAQVDSSTKGEKTAYAEIGKVGKVDLENNNQSEEVPHATPTSDSNTMTYAAVHIHEDGEKSTFHFVKDSA